MQTNLTVNEDSNVQNLIADRYLVTGVFGRGLQSTVYRVMRGSHELALRLHDWNLQFDSAEQAREWRRDGIVLISLAHPHVLQLVDFGLHGEGQLFTVFDVLQNRTTLSERIHNGPLPVQTALQIFAHIADALDLAHRKQLIHRRLTPSKISFEGDYPRLSDFDLIDGYASNADLLDGSQDNADIEAFMHYMSPEWCLGKKRTASMDLYSLAICLFETLTGLPPFHAGSANALARLHLEAPVPLIKDARLNFELPEKTDLFMARALAKNPADRFQSAREFKDAMLASLS